MKTIITTCKVRINKLLLCFCVTLVMVTLPLVAMPVTNTLPWSESFTNYPNGLVLHNTNGWSTSADPQAVVTNVGAWPESVVGTNICYVPPEGVLTHWIDSGSSSNVVWFDFFGKITLREVPPAIDSTASSMFYFNTNGHAVVQDGPTSNWVTLARDMFSGAVDGITNTVWARVTVVHNYTNQKWALFVDNKLLKDNIRFINTGITNMSSMVVSNKVYLDSMVATATMPDGSVYAGNTNTTDDADADGMPDYWELDAFGYISTQSGTDDTDRDGRSNASEFALGSDPTDPTDPASLQLPFRDGFESALAGAVTNDFWRGMSNFGTIAVSDSQYIEGSKSLGVHTGAVHVIVDDVDATNVWIQIYSKVQPFTDVPANNSLTTNEVMGFFVLTNGNLYAYDGDHWTNTASVPSVGTNLWLGFAIHLDYNADQYDLYVSTNNIYGAIMKRAHTNYLNFNSAASAATELTKIVVTNEANDYAYIDAIAVSAAYTNTGVASLTNLLAYDRLAGRTTSAQMPPYNYTGNDNLLTNQVGVDLMRELAEGDKLHVYTNGWQVYEYNGGMWQEDAGAAAIADTPINASMGMMIQRGGAGVDAVVFYPYGAPVTMSGDVPIYGTNETTYTFGWNLLTSPFSEIRYPNVAPGYGFVNPAVGDRIYLAGKRLSYDGTLWREGAAYATNALLPGAGFWYYHKGTGITWDVTP